MKHILWLDFETRSRVNLKKCGVYRYVECPDHRILIVGYALDAEPTKVAIIGPDGKLPADFLRMLADPEVQCRAHNAGFDRHQLKGLAPPIERWYCTMAQARAAARPGSLENLGRAMSSSVRKSTAGAGLIQKLSIPRRDGTFNDDPLLMRDFAYYCQIDTDAMRDISLSLPEMRDEDLAVYHASERVNDRGLPVDTELCELAVGYAKAEKIAAADRVIEISDGAIRSVQSPKLTEWVWDRLGPDEQKLMDKIKQKKKGVDTGRRHGTKTGGSQDLGTAKDVTEEHTKSLAVDVRAKLLDVAAERPGAIDPDVVEMIEAKEAGSLSSTAKFRTMLERVSDDGRLRGAFTLNGAVQTGRWTSTGAQVHNYPRQVAEDPEAVLALMRSKQPLDGVLHTLKGMLRPAIAPRRKGWVIVRGDWNAVEARGLPWLADNPGSRAYMAAFTDPTRDIYIEQAQAAGLGPQRQPGKVVVLSMGYGGTEVALANMAKNYGVHIEDRTGVVRRWRRANPWVADKMTGWWKSLERCAMQAIENPGRRYKAGRVYLRMVDKDLTMLLPSGRTLYYPDVRVVEGGYYGPEIEYLKASWKPTADATEWPHQRLWFGILAENATQAICADLLRDALLRAEKDGIEVIGHVHDELITEAPQRHAKAVGKALQRCMLASSSWAVGLPLKVEIDISPRFRK